MAETAAVIVAVENVTNNSSNFNRNINCAKDDDDDDDDCCNGSQERFASACSEVWKDVQAILHAASDLSSTVDPRDKELMKFPDETVVSVAHSLVEDVYESVSSCQSNLETIERHQCKLLASLITELDVQPDRHWYTDVRTLESLVLYS